MYLLFAQFVRCILPIQKVANARWRNRSFAGDYFPRLSAGVGYLCKNRRTGGMNAVAYLTPCRNKLVGVYHRHVIQGAFALLRYTHVAGDDKTDAALGISFIELCKLLGWITVFIRHTLVRSRAHDSAGQFNALELTGFIRIYRKIHI